MDFKEIFEEQLKKHNLNWCKGECGIRGHKRGFVLKKDKSTVHYDCKIGTRATLHSGFHEIGHCINDESGLRSYQCEAKAEEFASKTMREYGISVPRKTVALGKSYVRRKKSHGNNIKNTKRSKNE